MSTPASPCTRSNAGLCNGSAATKRREFFRPATRTGPPPCVRFAVNCPRTCGSSLTEVLLRRVTADGKSKDTKTKRELVTEVEVEGSEGSERQWFPGRKKQAARGTAVTKDKTEEHSPAGNTPGGARRKRVTVSKRLTEIRLSEGV